MDDINEQKGLARVHNRLDQLEAGKLAKIEEKLADILQRVSSIETSRQYQDKTIDTSESRHYDFLKYILPIIGGLLAVGAIASAFFSGAWGFLK